MHYLLDVSWLLYKGYYALSHVYEDYPEIHFITKKIESLLSRKDAIVHICVDGYDIKGKRLLKDAYKANRHQEGAYNVYEGLASFLKSLNNERIKVYYNKQIESDELIFTLSRTLDGRKKIISGDKDLLQALTKDVVIDNGSDLAITDESYKFEYADKFFGIEPYRLPLYRAIVGDASDTLKPPVPRFPHKLAARIVNALPYSGNVPSIEDLKSLLSHDEYKSSELNWINKLINAYDSYRINFEIMKLNVITDCLHEDYKYKEVEFSELLKSKISKLNTL